MKEIGLDDWLINTISDLYALYKKDYASQVSSAVEEVTGRKSNLQGIMQMPLDELKIKLGFITLVRNNDKISRMAPTIPLSS
jgi:hypothetical protein